MVQDKTELSRSGCDATKHVAQKEWQWEEKSSLSPHDAEQVEGRTEAEPMMMMVATMAVMMMMGWWW